MASSRVNVKFVIILSVVLVLVAIGAGSLAVMVLLKSGDDLAREGTARMTEGDYAAAEFLFSKAVNKDPYNEEFLLKWRDAMHAMIPESDREFETRFRSNYLSLHRQLASSTAQNNLPYQLEYLDLLAGAMQLGGFDRGGYENLASEAGNFIKIYQMRAPEDPSWAGLRRERGLALARIAIEKLDLTQEQVETAMADLAASLAAAPGDYDAVEGIVNIKHAQAASSRQQGRHDEGDDLDNEARAALESFLNTAPPDSAGAASARLLLSQLDLTHERQDAVARLGPSAIPEFRNIVAKFVPVADEAAEIIAALDPATIDIGTVRRLMAFEMQIDTESTLARTLAATERLVQGRPDDPEALLLRADVLGTTGQHEQAITVLQRVRDLPPRPLGLAGLSLLDGKARATFWQAEFALRAYRATEDEGERARWVGDAKKYREALAQIIPDTSPQVIMLDARLAYAEGDYSRAQTLLDTFNERTNNTSVDGLWLAADVADRLNQPGTARVRLQQLIKVNPMLASAHVALGELEYELQQFEAARTAFAAALQLKPDDTTVIERLRELEVRLNPETAADPVEGAILQARLIETGTSTDIPDPEGAIALLRKLLEGKNRDPRVFLEITLMQLRSGALEPAAATAADGLTAYPDDERLQRMKRALDASESLEAMEALIRESGVPEVQMYVSLYQLYIRADRLDLANQALAKASEVGPKDAVVIELEFAEAARAGNLDAMRAIAKRASEVDADRAGGLTYEARIMMREGREDDALAALTEASKRAPNSASIWRILARQQLETGRAANAITSFNRALEIRPSDRTTILDFTRALVSLGRFDEALDLARRSEGFARADADFMEILLGLEARVGDREGARDRREQIAKLRPDDMRNLRSLSELYMDNGDWAKARALIETIRAKTGADGALVALDARWYAEQNRLDDARRIFAAYVANTPPPDRLQPMVEMAQFLIRRGQLAHGVRALEQARPLQDPTTPIVDLALAESYNRMGRDDESVAVYRRLISAGLDKNYTMTKLAAEALIRLQRPEEARALIGSVPSVESDVEAQLLLGEIALTAGDDREARRIFDAAVEKWPDEPRVFVARGRALSKAPELRDDAVRDLERAIELAPEVWRSRLVLAQLLSEMDRPEDAIRQLREALRLNPGQDDLRMALIAEMVRRARESDAVEVAEEGFKLRPRDVQLRVRTAELFMRGGMRVPAMQFLEQTLSIEPNPDIAARVVGLMLDERPPRYADAERVLAGVGTTLVRSPALLMARGRVFANTNRVSAAWTDLHYSFSLVPKDADSMTYWSESLIRGVFARPEDLLAYLNDLAAKPGGAEWAGLFRARVLVDNPASASEGESILRTLLTSTRDPQVRYASLRALAGLQFRTQKFADAVALWKQALEIKPGDWSLENNIAYAMATGLNDPQGALPYAELACRHAPQDAEALDTIGTIYILLNRPKDAVTAMDAAVRNARTSISQMNYRVRLVEAILATGDKARASEMLSQIQGELDRGKSLDDSYKALLEKLRGQLGQG